MPVSGSWKAVASQRAKAVASILARAEYGNVSEFELYLCLKHLSDATVATSRHIADLDARDHPKLL